MCIRLSLWHFAFMKSKTLVKYKATHLVKKFRPVILVKWYAKDVAVMGHEFVGYRVAAISHNWRGVCGCYSLRQVGTLK
jgi:hypothetical protein